MHAFLDDHWTLDIEAEHALAVLTRSKTRYQAAKGLDASFEGLHRALDRAQPALLRMLVDARDGPGNNEPEFERHFADHRQRLLDRFRLVAVVIGSCTGMLHARRLIAEDARQQVYAFQDPIQARAWLTGVHGPEHQ